MFKLFIPLALALIFFRCKTIEVKKTALDSTATSGAFMQLPRTQLQIEINVKTTTYAKPDSACFNLYIDEFAGQVSGSLLDKLVSSNKVVSIRHAEVVISPVPVRDEEKQFSISTKGSFFQNRVYGLRTDKNGFPSSGEFSSENMVVPLVSQIISSAASFVSPFGAARIAQAKAKKKQQPPVDPEKRCALLFQKYTELEQNRREFSSLAMFKASNQLPSRDLYERVLTEMEKEKEDLFSHLMFATNVQIDKAVIRFTPTASDTSLTEGRILYVLDKSGSQPKLLVNSELIGDVASLVSSSPELLTESKTEAELNSVPVEGREKYYLKIVPEHWDKIQIATNGNDSSSIKPVMPTDSEGGMFYNVPLSCKVYLQKEKDKNWSMATIMLPQWGGMGRLSNKLSKQVIEYHPLYGSLVSVQAESKTIPPDQVKSFGESLNQARDVFYTDPIARMERRIQYLETKERLSEAEGNELSGLRKEKELLEAKKNVLELKKAIREYNE